MAERESAPALSLAGVLLGDAQAFGFCFCFRVPGGLSQCSLFGSQALLFGFECGLLLGSTALGALVRLLAFLGLALHFVGDQAAQRLELGTGDRLAVDDEGLLAEVGKPDACSHGLTVGDAAAVVGADADTVLEPDCSLAVVLQLDDDLFQFANLAYG